jgi:HEAT repeat protein/proteasome lid subunit RPN8/RPN11
MFVFLACGFIMPTISAGGQPRQTEAGLSLGPVCEINKGKAGDFGWRVAELNFTNGGEGVVRGYCCLFTIPNYWSYGYFSSHTYCELPGKLLRVRACGAAKDNHHFMAPAFWGSVNQYRLLNGKLYIACRVKPPREQVGGGKFSYVRPSTGTWQVWCHKQENGRLVWTVEVTQQGKVIAKEFFTATASDSREWMDVQIVLEPRRLTLQLNQAEVARLDHDPDERPFYLQLGSAQAKSGGKEVATEYREIFVNTVPYPYKENKFSEGPEDLRPQDRVVVGYVHKATPQEPRASEGDIIELKDGSILAVYSLYYAGKAWDTSPARIVGKISTDGGRSWGKPWPIADRDTGSEGNVMSVSLLRGQNGDLLMAYFDKTPDMKAKGMVLRRSTDEGKTWSPRIPITTANTYIANNACLVRLKTGRIVLALREYVWGVRMPLAAFSDDDGRTWKLGRHVPDADISAQEKQEQNLNEPCICELPDGRLLMTMRTVAGGQFFAWSSDQGQTWTKPVLSPLRGTCSPAILRRIPNRPEILAVWTYGFGGRTPLVAALSSDGGKTWKHLKLLEQSPYHGYGYVSCLFYKDRILLSYMHAPEFTSQFRFQAEPGYIDQRFINLPLDWLYRKPAALDQQCIEVLKSCLTDDNPATVVNHAGEALIAFGHTQGLTEIFLAMLNRKAPTREEKELNTILAARALYRLGKPEYIQSVVKILADPESPRRHTAAETLGKLGYRQADDLLRKILAQEPENTTLWVYGQGTLAKGGDPNAIKILLEKGFTSPHENIRRITANDLCQLRLPQAKPFIKRMMTEEPAQLLQVDAAADLFWYDDPAGLPLLKKALASNDPLIRAHAVRAFINLKTNSDPEFLQPLLQDPDPDTRTLAAHALLHTLKNQHQ